MKGGRRPARPAERSTLPEHPPDAPVVASFVPMDDAQRVHLVLLRGGRGEGDAPAAAPLPRGALRVIPGGPAGDVQAAIEETVQAARRMREEIEARIAKALEYLF